MTYTDKVAIKVVLLTIIALLAVPYYFIAGGTILGFIAIRLVAHLIALFTPVAYHRWLCHNSFQPNLLGKFLMGTAMIGSGFGDPLHNVVAHRLHHPHADTDKDPHSTDIGFWKLWLGQFKVPTGGVRPPKDFFRNNMAVFMHNHYWKLYVLFNIMLFLIFDLKTVLIYCPINFVYGWTLNTMVNYYGHIDPDTGAVGPRNTNQVFTLLTAGEGLHGNHHITPASADFSSTDRKDPMSGVIKLISKTG